MRVLRTTVAGLVCALMAVPAMAQRDDYMCYAVKQTKGSAAYGKTDATKKFYAALNDVLSPANVQGLDPNAVPGTDATVQMKKVKELCIATNNNGDGVSDDSTAYIMYQISPQKGQCSLDPAIPCKEGNDEPCTAASAGTCVGLAKFDKKNPQNTGVRVQDANSDLRLDFGKEVMVLSPATTGNGSFAGVPDGEEAYKCYSVKPAKSSCVGGTSDGESCKDNSTCGGGGICTANAKFPKETHPNGITASIDNGVTALFDDVSDPEKAMNLSKLKMFCQAADTKLAGDPANFRSEQQAGLLCYAAKAAKAACDLGANDNQPCKSDDDCPGGTCREEAKFDKKNATLLGTYVEDDLFQHRLDIAKEDMLCVPACRGDNDLTEFAFNDLVAHVTSLQFAPVDVGVNVDGLTTCQPAGCTPALGIDNALGLPFLTSIINPLLEEQIETGSINLLFQVDQLVDGNVTISGFLGDLDANPGCAAGDANNPPVDPGNPLDPCNYVADSSSFTDPLRSTCTEQEALISLDVTLSGSGTAPTATAQGGGPGNDFTLNIPLGGQSFQITAKNVLVDATVTHDTSDISQINGVLGGGVNHQALIDAVATIPGECNGGSNAGGACTNDAQCPGGACYLSDSITFSPENLAQTIGFLIPPDLDLDPNDSPGTNGGCPACESVSLNLQFTATEAIVTGSN